MKIMQFVAASAIILGMASAARAADMIPSEEPTPEYMPPSFSWTGAYIGAAAGYGWGKTKFESPGEEYVSSVDSKGFIGGLFAGYNWEAGDGFVVGADADFNYARVKESFGSTDVDENGNPYSSGGDTKLKWVGAARARVGYAVDRFLPYIAGGVAFGKVERSFYVIDPISMPAAVAQSFNKTQVGWTAGAGVDYAATDNIFVRLEYRYTDLGKKDFTFMGDEYESKFKMHEVRVGVAYKF
ncbi:outer membrane protein [Phyllobacterium leguminum]|uniref:Outer membrane immunogenic protein n=1 Tax=Phyllobacterium leguminum TaxID=314237 RepID=A0A318T844_9HYPH|nr:outer membrane protein [Phyllobacterium leguminum]PYE89361.1 outer membrane immunogenic protein [Phyllobacterium leguminum]